jgi:predicted metal-dependent phosphoesterase TrpH
MTIDLHVHSNCSDGVFSVSKIMKEARNRNIHLLSITDHDTVACQEEAIVNAKMQKIHYVTGAELNIALSHPDYQENKPVSLDLLGYQFNWHNKTLVYKLRQIAEYRRMRAEKILNKINIELKREDIEELTSADFNKIQSSIDGVLGRPHIAGYLVEKGIVRTIQEAFDKYLVKCNVPKYPLHLDEASRLIRDAGGIAILAHPNDPHGTSLIKLTESLQEQTKIISETMLDYIDGVECWHSRNSPATTNHYIKFSKEHNLIMTGGSDCHQKPVLMGSIDIPNYVASQFSY